MPITINAYQLRQAAEFAAPDYETDADQRDTCLCIEYLPAGKFSDGEDRPAGLYCWYEDYPEEGCMLLEKDVPAPVTPNAGNEGREASRSIGELGVMPEGEDRESL